MCLILFSYMNHPEYKLILASNRDEFFDRPTRPLDFWEPDQSILAGRDEKDMGTWLGVTDKGKFAAITNYRDPSSVKLDAPSRGHLVKTYLENDIRPLDYLNLIQPEAHRYNGFNLIAGDPDGLYYFSNRKRDVERVEPGIHGLSNAFLNTPWPKVERGKKILRNLVESPQKHIENMMFNMLSDVHQPQDRELPDTGIGLEWERMLAPMFIHGTIYGTRASSVILISHTGKLTFMEKSFIRKPGHGFDEEMRSFDLMCISVKG